MDIPRLEREKLKDIVRQYIANEIFFSAQLRDPSLLGMVFTPVMFGAFSYPVEKPQGTVKPEAPVRPVRPVRGDVDLGKEGQKLDTDIANTTDLITQVEFRVRWNDASEDELTGLRANLEALQDQRAELVVRATARVERDHRILLDNYLHDLKAYRKARHAWRALVATWEEREEGLARRLEVWEAGAKAWGDALLEALQDQRAELVVRATARVERDHRILLDNYLHDLKAYRKARHAWRALVATWEEREEGLARRLEVWEAGAKAWGDALEQNLGVLYAYHKDSMPRAVNGYPMFTSCSVLHKLDWDWSARPSTGSSNARRTSNCEGKSMRGIVGKVRYGVALGVLGVSATLRRSGGGGSGRVDRDGDFVRCRVRPDGLRRVCDG